MKASTNIGLLSQGTIATKCVPEAPENVKRKPRCFKRLRIHKQVRNRLARGRNFIQIDWRDSNPLARCCSKSLPKNLMLIKQPTVPCPETDSKNLFHSPAINEVSTSHSSNQYYHYSYFEGFYEPEILVTHGPESLFLR